MSRPELSPRPKADQPLINVVYHPEMLQNDIQYEVEIDAPKCSQFLKEHGMNPRRIPRKTIVLRRTIIHKPKYYDEVVGLQKKGEVFLACDTLWKYEDRSRKVDQKENDQFSANETLQHELKHLIDASLLHYRFVDGMVKGVFFGSGPLATSLLMTLFHQPGLKSAAVGFFVQCGVMGELIAHMGRNPNENIPHERRANRFTEKLGNDPRWQNLITMTPKQQDT